MIGLEYILSLYNMPHTKLAEELGIARQNINLWIKGKGKIPKKYLPKLSEMFNIAEEYFQKELNEIDKLKIQKLKIKNEMEEIEYEDTIIDQNTGEEIKVTSTYVDNGALFAIDVLDFEIQEKELLQKIKKSIEYYLINYDEDDSSGGYIDAERLLKDYKFFVDLITDERVNRKILMEVLKAVRISYKQGFDTDDFINNIIKLIKERQSELENMWKEE
ncbi:plasmid maintenance system antidote protein VapI [Clostridium pascui]|uniref:helix-turn-helix domain-containing protein n=1 Tax=Clostridium pascui TaxID=46609 RepID=UPI001958093D|nr:helix-turn-helix domain-containing protein [Clostridium pascui]MBM7869249.1 plasmid maintenance system antidote protein VapI [Clostridium pascui]